MKHITTHRNKTFQPPNIFWKIQIFLKYLQKKTRNLKGFAVKQIVRR